ncbi:MAG: twin-arginine translocase subunit TatB [Acidimicrobiales bacterium]|nr:twin-arginine translocase subunit TatB [Acidimicrobiales bacterium]
MFNVSGPEILIILVVALIVLGPDKLPEAVRKMGGFMREIRRISSGFQDEVRDALSDVEVPPARATPMRVAPTPVDPIPTDEAATAPSPPGSPTNGEAPADSDETPAGDLPGAGAADVTSAEDEGRSAGSSAA